MTSAAVCILHINPQTVQAPYRCTQTNRPNTLSGSLSGAEHALFICSNWENTHPSCCQACDTAMFRESAFSAHRRGEVSLSSHKKDFKLWNKKFNLNFANSIRATHWPVGKSAVFTSYNGAVLKQNNKATNITCLLFEPHHVTWGDIKDFLSNMLSFWIWGYNMAFVVMLHWQI